ncbi:unnamed protein product [Linum trigynum]|uniref:Uncharacterized protein n=1 Tax=Linum trigynum TaxID=586398 RepID=A0AAV2FJG9_9ROSI
MGLKRVRAVPAQARPNAHVLTCALVAWRAWITCLVYAPPLAILQANFVVVLLPNLSNWDDILTNQSCNFKHSSSHLLQTTLHQEFSL